ncbi:chemotaxis response regulator protein-glutamate methylesterase [Nocardioides sp. R-C-SC26]|uniref:protein-glutamate methylesterase/protein-glutamine glutaminase n=1 Tax=Nocardioides sp. R-C-SC26 TaxID=2870414 RepID=UPI001E4ECD49|nr:chemotaxis response regulator protein-glutamate methylesterase [Nocardioides sp. R-C-SC26]
MSGLSSGAAAGAPIRVLVVDDSAVLRRLISTVLGKEPDLEVVGTACDGLEAIDQVEELRPDVVTLDVEMPRLDGLGAVERIHAAHPRLPVIMFSTLTAQGASATLTALSRGASDYVTKPSGSGDIGASMERVREDLVPRIRALAGARRVVASSAPVRVRAAAPQARRPQVLVVASSTGGPDALSQVVAGLPASFPLPVLVAQHMPPLFTAQFAERLDRVGPLSVAEAADGDVLRPGRILVAPGDFHLRVGRSGALAVARLDQEPPENFCRPAADPLLRSAVEVYGGGVLALVLTGMGHDGLAGCREVVAAGGRVVVQDEETSVVWGMPGAVADAGLAHEVLALPTIPARLAAHAVPDRALTRL